MAYRTRTYNQKIRNLLHYPIMLMPHSRYDRIRTCITRFWRPLHSHSCSTPVKRRRRDSNPHALSDNSFQDCRNTILHHNGKTRLVGLEPTHQESNSCVIPFNYSPLTMREGFEPPVRRNESLVFKTSPVPLWHRTIYIIKKEPISNDRLFLRTNLPNTQIQ